MGFLIAVSVFVSVFTCGVFAPLFCFKELFKSPFVFGLHGRSQPYIDPVQDYAIFPSTPFLDLLFGDFQEKA